MTLFSRYNTRSTVHFKLFFTSSRLWISDRADFCCCCCIAVAFSCSRDLLDLQETQKNRQRRQELPIPDASAKEVKPEEDVVYAGVVIRS
ncbi:hypothetical protein cypCar_00014209 [Cyprinus carpio]|nr:hypothetical protein cypCar_00014209 [Cyprinus carpio]